MKMLLTDSGIRNKSIHNALLDLLGKPVAECNALAISTASYPLPGGPNRAWTFISGQDESPMTELGWKSVGVLELTALPSLDKAHWVSIVEEADVLLVNGGDTVYLAYWLRKSGLADLLPSLRAVYVGLSAGSLVMSPSLDNRFAHWTQPNDDAQMLGLVDFVMFPHVDYPLLPTHSMAHAEQWAAGLQVPGYIMDDQTAIKVVDGSVEVVSEGNWKLMKQP